MSIAARLSRLHKKQKNNMARIKIPSHYSSREAKSVIAKALSDSTLSVQEQLQLEEQYREYSNGAPFAKGGSVTKQTPKQTKKVAKVMGEFKEGTLHSGKGGKVVKSPKQAIAIALSEAKVKPKKK